MSLSSSRPFVCWSALGSIASCLVVNFLVGCLLLIGLLVADCRANEPRHSNDQKNLLILTVDDMNCDSMGVYGCKLPGTTPNMDALAKSGLRFEYAHVQVGNCMPSRNVMWSGRYPHNNGVEGFYQVPNASHPMLCDLAKEAGYFTAIRHKIGHSSPYSPYHWDLELDVVDGVKAHTKDAASYGNSVVQGIEAATEADKPFFLCINVSDPHKPFYSQVKNGKDPHVPSLIYSAEQVPVPGFLPDDPIVRQEVALYYSTVRRADDAVGSVMDALRASGKQDETIVLFLSDHGMPLPFAKTQLYHHSTRTPLVIRVPGVTVADSSDSEHMVSAVDFVPTLADLMNWRKPEALDGRSFASIVSGQQQENRDFVIKEYNENSGSKRNPMRAIETKEFLYVFNPWSNGTRPMATATNGTASYKRMKQLAKENADIASRIELMDHRVVEELYNVSRDPDCLENLIGLEEFADVADDMRTKLQTHMQQTKDPIADLLHRKDEPAYLEHYMLTVQNEADARRASRKAGQQKAQVAKQSPQAKGLKKKAKLIALQSAAVSEDTVVVTLGHKMPERIGRQEVTVTLKDPKKKRVSRQEVIVFGVGTTDITFETDRELDLKRCHIAAFVGPSYQENLQHLQKSVSELSKD